MAPFVGSRERLLSFVMSICSLSIAFFQNVSSSVSSVMYSKIGDCATASRPRVKVRVGDTDMDWLYDTGASRSCMSTRHFQALFPNGYHEIFLPHQSTVAGLQDAGGNSLNLNGIVPLNLTILGKTIKHDIWICDNLTDAIIGIDLIDKFQLQYDTLSRSIHWRNQTHNPVLSLTQNTTFPALTTTIIKAKFNGKSDFSLPHIATIFCKQTKALMGGPALVKINDEGFCTIAVTNCATHDITIERTSIVACIETDFDCTKATQLSQEKITSIFETINSVAAHKSVNSFTREQIEQKANINVPQQFHRQYVDLLYKHKNALSMSNTDLGRARNFFHRIHLKDRNPVYRKQYKIPDAHAKFISDSIDDWLKLGIIRRSASMYNSPIFCVPKKAGHGLRIVQDFRELNLNSHIDKYSMKEISECIGEIGRANSTIFSTLDLTSGFWQMPLHPQDTHLTAFTVPGRGQFEWLTSPMGLLGCPASFQRLMEAALQGIAKVIVYIDDLLIHSASHEEQLVSLSAVFDRLVSHGLKVNLDKCVFGNNNVSYLGFTLTPNGIKPGKDKLQAVRDAKPPTDIKMVRSFIGLCNFFRTHIKNFSTISQPLTKLTRNDSNYKGGTLPPEAMRAFLQLKLALTSNPVVAYPRADRHYALIVDASTGSASSEGGMGAILSQIDKNGTFHVLSYGSRQLVKHEKNYSPYLLEMAAAVWGMEFYNEYLKGKQFTLYTDHRPLEKLSHLHTKTLNRLQLAMLEYDFVIQYKKGINMPADFLSRSKIDEIAAIDPFSKTLAHEQAIEPDVIKLKFFHEKGAWPAGTSNADIRKLQPLLSNFFVRDGCIWIRLSDFERQRTALFLPYKFRKRAMCEAHGSTLAGHDALNKTYIRITDSYFWPGIRADIRNHVQSCLQCQLRKKIMPKPVPLHPLPITDQPNQRVHVDLFGPLKASGNANKYILCITDAFTKHAEVIAIANKQADTVATEIFNKWICRFGSPIQIHSDGGKEFCNKLSDELFQKLDIKHTKTSPAHPQCNAQVEVFNKTVAKYLSSFVDQSTLDWEQYIPMLMFSYNTSYHSTIMTTPFELLFGMRPRVPSFPHQDIQRIHYGESFASDRIHELQKARQIANQHMTTKTEQTKQVFDQKSQPHAFKVGDMVLFAEHDFRGKNRKLAAKWVGPAEVVHVSETNVKIKCKNNRIKKLNVKYIKPFLLESAQHKNFNDADDNFNSDINKDACNKQTDFSNAVPQHRPLTRALTRLIHERHSINFVANDLYQRLLTICIQLYKHNVHVNDLPEADKLLWQSYELDDILFFLTGQREHTPDFTEYLSFSQHPQPQQFVQPQQPPIIQPAPEIDNSDNDETFSTPPPSPQQNHEQFLTPTLPSHIKPENVLPHKRLSRPPQRLNL